MSRTEFVHAYCAVILLWLCFINENHCDAIHPLHIHGGRIPNSIITIAIYEDGSSSISYNPPKVSHLQLAAVKSLPKSTEALALSELAIEGAASRSAFSNNDASKLSLRNIEATTRLVSVSAEDINNSFTSSASDIVNRSTTAVPKSTVGPETAQKYLKLGIFLKPTHASSGQLGRSSVEVSEITEGAGANSTETGQGVDGHPAWRTLSASECGESFSDRIIGGVDAKLGQYPWLARIGYEEEDAPEGVEFRCGGVLVAPRIVLTAAHCVHGLIIAKVRLGEHDISSDEDCDDSMCAEPVQDFVPARSHVHELFNQPRYANDVAMLELDRDADYNGWVAPICLPRGTALTNTFAGTFAHAAGWGVLDMNTQATARTLQTVRLPVLSRARCVHTYRRKATISEEQMCAGAQPDKDACSGDSGGPLMKVLSEDGTPRYFLLGVVSFGPRICGTKQPGVYANVSHHMPWILDHIKLDYD